MKWRKGRALLLFSFWYRGHFSSSLKMIKKNSHTLAFWHGLHLVRRTNLIVNVRHIRWMTSKTLDKIAKHYQIALDSDLDDVVSFFSSLFHSIIALWWFVIGSSAVYIYRVAQTWSDNNKDEILTQGGSYRIDSTWLSYKRFKHWLYDYCVSNVNTQHFFSSLLLALSRQTTGPKQEKTVHTRCPANENKMKTLSICDLKFARVRVVSRWHFFLSFSSSLNVSVFALSANKRNVHIRCRFIETFSASS